MQGNSHFSANFSHKNGLKRMVYMMLRETTGNSQKIEKCVNLYLAH